MSIVFDFNIGLDNFVGTDPNVWFVCAMGVGTVFVGLICLIIVCKLLSVLVRGNDNKQEQAAAPIVAPAAPAPQQPIENKQELLAAISAAVAEELGTDVSGIRITSFKKL